MKKIHFNFVALVIASLGSVDCLNAIDVSSLTKQIRSIHKELGRAVQGLRQGKGAIAKIYHDGNKGLKPQLIDSLDQTIKSTSKTVKSIKSALDPLQKIPNFIKPIAMKIVKLPDLEGTLTWLVDTPLNAIIDSLSTTKKEFEAVGERVRPGAPQSALLYEKLDMAVAKLEKANCRVERLLAAFEDDFVISEACVW